MSSKRVTSPGVAALISALFTLLLVVFAYPFFLEREFRDGYKFIPEEGIVVKAKNDAVFLLNPYDLFVSAHIYRHQCWEPNITELLKRIVKKHDSVLVLGAHIGYHAIAIAKLVGNEGEVFAFEPNPISFKYLTVNKLLNDLDNIELYQKAASSSDGELNFSVIKIGNTGMSHVARNEQEIADSISVDAVAIDNIKEIKDINVLLMDIEGAEESALEGMQNLIKNNRDIVIIQEWSPEWLKDPEKYLQFFRNDGFSIWKVNHDGEFSLFEMQDKDLLASNQIDIVMTRQPGVILSQWQSL